MGVPVNKYKLLMLSSLLLIGCVEEGMLKYDGANPSKYFKENCLNKPSKVQDTEECRKSNHDAKMRSIDKEPIKNW
jgi:hypothetical protein